MRQTILSVLILAALTGCAPIRVPVYAPPAPLRIEKDALRPIFTIDAKSGYKVKSEAIVRSYAQCEARVDYLEKLKS
jgi:hypothetical protein